MAWTRPGSDRRLIRLRWPGSVTPAHRVRSERSTTRGEKEVTDVNSKTACRSRESGRDRSTPCSGSRTGSRSTRGCLLGGDERWSPAAGVVAGTCSRCSGYRRASSPPVALAQRGGYGLEPVLLQHGCSAHPARTGGPAAGRARPSRSQRQPVVALVRCLAGQHQRTQRHADPADHQQRPVLAARGVVLIGHPGPDDLTGIGVAVGVGE
jgi:hypothetical protein